MYRVGSTDIRIYFGGQNGLIHHRLLFWYRINYLRSVKNKVSYAPNWPCFRSNFKKTDIILNRELQDVPCAHACNQYRNGTIINMQKYCNKIYYNIILMQSNTDALYFAIRLRLALNNGPAAIDIKPPWNDFGTTKITSKLPRSVHRVPLRRSNFIVN